MAKIGYADPVSAISAAVGQAVQGITSVLGLRQQRLAQESADSVQKEALRTQVELSEEQYWRQISAQNADFGKGILSLETQKRNIWQTPTGILIIIAVPILIGVLVYFIIKGK